MKDARIGSCWVYAEDDCSMYQGQIVIIISTHRDALGDYDYEGWFSPLNRVFDISDVVLQRDFKCISLNEDI